MKKRNRLLVAQTKTIQSKNGRDSFLLKRIPIRSLNKGEQ